MESSEARLPANANSSGSAAVDGFFVKLRSCADPAESCSKEPTDLQFNGSSRINLNIRASLAAEYENCTKNNTPEEKKRLEASHISGSLERETSTTGNFANQKAQSMKVKNWACVKFSSISGKSVLRFLRKLGKTCLSIGMINLAGIKSGANYVDKKNSYSPTDIENSLWTVHEFFDNHEMKKDQAKFVLVILPDTRISDVKVRQVCKHVGHAHHCCLPLKDCMEQ